MENRKSYVLTAAILIAVGVFLRAVPAAAYEVNTHAYLTSEAIELYNKHTKGNKITSELKRFVIDGAIHEDDDPRYRNHFYDPINNEGLNDMGLSGQSAKEWVRDGAHQGKAGYALLSDSSLAPVDRQKIEGLKGLSDFTWDAGIRYWLQGEEEMAMEVLGHVMHVMEDMGVPEHTRNDAHPDGSAYEEYVSRYDANNPDQRLRDRLGDKQPATLRSLDAYFDGLAKYSNKYFYSPGSLGGYDFPELDYRNAETKEGKYYISNKDDEGNKYYLAIKKNIANISLGYSDVSIDRDTITESYWNLLSVRTVRYSAGVIDLFFRDVEKAKNDPDFLKKEVEATPSIVQRASGFVSSLWSGTKSIAAKTGTFFGNVFGVIGDGIASATSFVGGLFTNDHDFADAGSVDLGSDELNTEDKGAETSKPSGASSAAAKKSASTKKDDEIAALKLQIAQLQKEAQIQDKAVLALEKKKSEDVVEKEAEKAEPVKESTRRQDNGPLCSYAAGSGGSRKSVIINEVAWMGGARSAGDEWIELKNVSGSDIDVFGWQLLNKGGGVKVRLSELKDTVIEPGQFVLLERTDNNSAVGATADMIYSGALGNSNDGLKLFDGSCAVADEISVAAHWAAGDNDSKQTMERKASGNGWQTSATAGGTPKKENSGGVVYSGGGSTGSSSNRNTQSGVGGDPLSVAPQFYPVIINEIMYDLPGTDSDREWIELYNSGSSTAAIGEWKLFENDTSHALTIEQGLATIPAGGYAIIAENKDAFLQDNSGFSGTIFESAFSLSNEGESIALKNSTLVIDSATYASSTGADGDGRSLQLFGTTWEAASSTPGRVNERPIALEQEVPGPVATSTQSVHDTFSHPLSVITYYQTLATSTAYTVGSFSVYGSGIAGRWRGGVCEFNIATRSCSTVLAQPFADIDMPSAGAETLLTFGLSTPVTLDAGTQHALYVQPTGSVHIKDRVSRIAGSATDAYPGGRAYAFGQYEPYYVSEDVDPGLADLSFTISAVSYVAPQATSTEEIPAGSGEAATSTATTTIPQFYPIVINEIMYDLPDSDEYREWIELYNTGTTTADITDWKFYEQETHHGLTLTQGSAQIPAGGYAVIVAHGPTFIVDHAGFLGTVFDSSFSLSNEGEVLAVKNGDLVIDTVTYVSSIGAQGDGMSLQKFADGWHAASSTPGVENVLPVVIVVEASTSTDPIIPNDTATTTPTSTPSVLPMGQSVDTDKAPLGQTHAFYQTIAPGAVVTVSGFRVVAEGVAGRWQGGVCEFDPVWKKCISNLYLARVSADVDVVNSSERTPLVFTFASPVALDAGKQYALGVLPTGSVPLGNRTASVYGSATDLYSGGALYRSEDGMHSVSAGIADMYFELN